MQKERELLSLVSLLGDKIKGKKITPILILASETLTLLRILTEVVTLFSSSVFSLFGVMISS